MYYEINVSFKGIHLFATAERSLTHESKARDVYSLLRTCFPTSEGYEIAVIKYESSGTDMTENFETETKGE